MNLKKIIPFTVVTITSATLIITSCVQPAPAQNLNGNLTPNTPASPATIQKSTQAFQKLKKQKKISNNASYRAQLNRVASKLKKQINLPGAHWEFVVFDDPTPNAFALPGGKVGVHSGMFQITRTDAGLAAVVGHEIAHITLNHAEKRNKRAMGAAIGGIALDILMQSQGARSSDRQAAAGAYGLLATSGVLLPYSRNQELQSDRIGAVYMAKAGYNPNEAVNLWKRFSHYKSKNTKVNAPAFLSTHPLDSTRITKLQQFMPVAMQNYRQ